MVYALGAVILWSSLATLAFHLANLPPFFLTGIALLVGAAAMAVQWRQWRVRWSTFCLGAGALVIYHALLFTALRWAPPVTANLVNYLWPLLIVVLAPLIQSQSTWRLQSVVAAGLGFAGAALAITGGHELKLARGEIMGYALALAAAFTWALYSLILKRVPPFPYGAVGLFNLGAGLISLGISFATEDIPQISAVGWFWLIGIGLGPLGFAFYFWNRAALSLPATQLGVVSFLTPVLSTTALILSTGHTPGPGVMGGALLVLLSIALALYGDARKQK